MPGFYYQADFFSDPDEQESEERLEARQDIYSHLITERSLKAEDFKPGLLVTPTNPKSRTATWVGIVIAKTENPNCWIFRWPQRQDTQDIMNSRPAKTLDLWGGFVEYQAVPREGEKRHLYHPGLYKEFPWYRTKRPNYLSYKEYLTILEKLKDK